ncbi:hypothetical protein L6452_25837 [Arctium lappa]|uniref:Uncharacterized protein n=1 Tax=Arctium lappa TaxID=4217 RepID=A0ACB9ACF7_ARCLA|nr:hypothetical protein L6452_25837 [Arctium lappa]
MAPSQVELEASVQRKVVVLPSSDPEPVCFADIATPISHDWNSPTVGKEVDIASTKESDVDTKAQLFKKKARTKTFHIIINQVSVALNQDPDFNRVIKKLVWNVHISPEEFESQWHNMIEEYNLVPEATLISLYSEKIKGSENDR